jgi:hypothetical protein
LPKSQRVVGERVGAVAARSGRARHPDPARRYIVFLASTAAADAITKTALEPLVRPGSRGRVAPLLAPRAVYYLT